MAKIKGDNVRIYLSNDLLAHTNEVSINLETGIEEVTDADSGNYEENAPTLNRGNIDTTTWYNNAVAGGADFNDVLDAYLNQTLLLLHAQIEPGVTLSGYGYLTNLNPSGGTAGAYVKFTAGFVFTGEIS